MDAKEVLRLRLIDWQDAGWSRMPALSGAEVIINDLQAAGFVIAPAAAHQQTPPETKP